MEGRIEYHVMAWDPITQKWQQRANYPDFKTSTRKKAGLIRGGHQAKIERIEVKEQVK